MSPFWEPRPDAFLESRFTFAFICVRLLRSFKAVACRKSFWVGVFSSRPLALQGDAHRQGQRSRRAFFQAAGGAQRGAVVGKGNRFFGHELELVLAELDDVAVLELHGLAGHRAAVDRRAQGAFDVGEHVAARALGDRGHLHAGLAELDARLPAAATAPLAIRLDASGVRLPDVELKRTTLSLDGSRARHRMQLVLDGSLAGQVLSLQLAAQGGVQEAPWGWSGRIDTLENKQQYGIIRTQKGRRSWIGGTYRNGWIDGTIKELGNYTVGQDLKAPTITPLGANTWISKQAFVFRLSDNLSGVQTYRGEIDGQFVLFEMNNKSVITYRFDKERLQRGKHELKLIVTDACGNESIYTHPFTW